MKKAIYSILLTIVLVFQVGLMSSCTESETSIKKFEYEEVNGGMKITKYLGSDKKVVVPSTIENKKVIEITDTVFSGNVVLKEITLPDTLPKADLSLFKNCDNLEKITLLGSYSDIGTQHFKSLKELNFTEISTECLYDIKTILSNSETLDTINIEKVTDASDYKTISVAAREKSLIDRKISLSIPEELERQILKSTVIKQQNLIPRDNNYINSEVFQNDKKQYTLHVYLGQTVDTVDVEIPNGYRSRIINRFFDKGYSLNSDFKVYYSNGDYFINGKVNNSQDFIFPIKVEENYRNSSNQKIHIIKIDGYTYYEWENRMKGSYSAEYYERIATNVIDGYINSTIIIEELDNSAIMPVYFNAKDITVNGANYKFDFK